jgi:hypothetical protein
VTTPPALLAWHGSADLKAEVVARMKAHRDADSIVQGIYQGGEDGLPLGYEGCVLGCTLPHLTQDELDRLYDESRIGGSGWWGRIQTEYGIPLIVAQLIDYTFEAQDNPDHAAFAVEVIEAIPVGADLSGIHDQWVEAQMNDVEPRTKADWLIQHLAAAPTPEAAPC